MTLRLVVLILGYAFERARARDQRLAGWRDRQLAFQLMVTHALDQLWLDVAADNRQADRVDDKVDREL